MNEFSSITADKIIGIIGTGLQGPPDPDGSNYFIPDDSGAGALMASGKPKEIYYGIYTDGDTQIPVIYGINIRQEARHDIIIDIINFKLNILTITKLSPVYPESENYSSFKYGCVKIMLNPKTMNVSLLKDYKKLSSQMEALNKRAYFSSDKAILTRISVDI